MISSTGFNDKELKDVISSTSESSSVSKEPWDSLSDTVLLEQKNLLIDRWVFLRQSGYPYAESIAEAIDKIDRLIASRS